MQARTRVQYFIARLNEAKRPDVLAATATFQFQFPAKSSSRECMLLLMIKTAVGTIGVVG
jgi:hypothetical protein